MQAAKLNTIKIRFYIGKNNSKFGLWCDFLFHNLFCHIREIKILCFYLEYILMLSSAINFITTEEISSF